MNYEAISKTDPICRHCRGEFMSHVNGACQMDDYNAPFIAADGDRWYIVQNTDLCDDQGDHGLRHRVFGDPNGYRTYHEALEAKRELRL